MYGLLVALIVGIVLLVIAYTVALPAQARQILLVFGYILAIVGGLLFTLVLLGIPIALGARG